MLNLFSKLKKGKGGEKNMTAVDVAKWFYKNNSQAKRDNKSGNVVIQKLCYYAQAMYLAVYGEPLFDEKITAWESGPVIEQVYKKYRWGILFLQNFDVKNITEKEEEILKVINSVYGYKTPDELIKSTHLEKPWKQYEEIASDRNNNPEITKDELKEYYKILKDVYEANKDNDFSNEKIYISNGCNFSYNSIDISDISKYRKQLNEFASAQDANKSFCIYLDGNGELVIYE